MQTQEVSKKTDNGNIINVYENNLKNAEGKIEWIVVLKALACILVVMSHVKGGWLDVVENPNLSGIRWFFNSVFIQTIQCFAIPCFIMISGCLLLNPKRNVTITKIKKYIIKMLYILGIFGFGFCLIENILNMGLSDIFKLLYKSVFDLIQQNSWAHMWYVYMLIGLYIITPILRKFVETTDASTVKFTLLSLFIVSNLIPTINELFNINITTFYLSSFNYIFIYLMGYYLVYTDIIKDKYIYLFGIIGIILYVTISCFFKFNPPINVFMLLGAMLLIKLFSTGKIMIKNNKIIECISKYSLPIYLVHPFWLNILNKGLGIYPDVLPDIIGEIVFFMYALILSLITSIILYKLPIIKKIW